MSSMVIFESNGVTVQWNKQAPYTMRVLGEPVRCYQTREGAMAAAKRKARLRSEGDSRTTQARLWPAGTNTEGD